MKDWLVKYFSAEAIPLKRRKRTVQSFVLLTRTEYLFFHLFQALRLQDSANAFTPFKFTRDILVIFIGRVGTIISSEGPTITALCYCRKDMSAPFIIFSWHRGWVKGEEGQSRTFCVFLFLPFCLCCLIVLMSTAFCISSVRILKVGLNAHRKTWIMYKLPSKGGFYFSLSRVILIFSLRNLPISF